MNRNEIQIDGISEQFICDNADWSRYFKVAGGGQNYVHGGSSLQEMLIPVIELTTNTRAVAYDYVDVILTSVNRKVTNLITYFDFIQTEKVTDTMKARSLVAYFTTEEGERYL